MNYLRSNSMKHHQVNSEESFVETTLDFCY